MQDEFEELNVKCPPEGRYLQSSLLVCNEKVTSFLHEQLNARWRKDVQPASCPVRSIIHILLRNASFQASIFSLVAPGLAAVGILRFIRSINFMQH